MNVNTAQVEELIMENCLVSIQGPWFHNNDMTILFANGYICKSQISTMTKFSLMP